MLFVERFWGLQLRGCQRQQCSVLRLGVAVQLEHLLHLVGALVTASHRLDVARNLGAVLVLVVAVGALDRALAADHPDDLVLVPRRAGAQAAVHVLQQAGLGAVLAVGLSPLVLSVHLFGLVQCGWGALRALCFL